ncbi:RPS30B [Brettanomyces bruxellensis]|uniref:40S ribosomal protein S30 n=1 Tax=Dekkera bruxellensis TaxID=5007 RepID=A0A7D9GYL0_DEKBR|nr:RPS30B [Brettanomyces bruxellensis]
MGKVHGSLARAGKVKSQTPKVEKTEKPKKPKGRAYKDFYTPEDLSMSQLLQTERER